MQMQQIQTPSGPKLIAVPVAQAAAAAAAAAGQTVITQPLTSPNLAVINPPEETKVKEKKSKKKAAKAVASAILQQHVQQTAAAQAAAASAENKAGLDLGELMKDVGLDDLDGYNSNARVVVSTGTNPNAGAGISTVAGTTEATVLAGGSVQNAIISSQGNQTIMTAPLTLATSGGNQIVAQLPQQILSSVQVSSQ